MLEMLQEKMRSSHPLPSLFPSPAREPNPSRFATPRLRIARLCFRSVRALRGAARAGSPGCCFFWRHCFGGAEVNGQHYLHSVAPLRDIRGRLRWHPVDRDLRQEPLVPDAGRHAGAERLLASRRLHNPRLRAQPLDGKRLQRRRLHPFQGRTSGGRPLRAGLHEGRHAGRYRLHPGPDFQLNGGALCRAQEAAELGARGAFAAEMRPGRKVRARACLSPRLWRHGGHGGVLVS